MLFAKSEAVPPNGDHGGMVQQPVQNIGGYHPVAKHASPLVPPNGWR